MSVYFTAMFHDAVLFGNWKMASIGTLGEFAEDALRPVFRGGVNLSYRPYIAVIDT